MDINATLIGQSIAFLVFVLFCYKFVWPALSGAIEKRQKEIEESINSAAKLRDDIATEKNQADLEINRAKLKAKEIESNAEKEAAQIIEQARVTAQAQAQLELDRANQQIAQEKARASQELRAQVGAIAVQIAEKIIKRELSVKDNQDLIEDAISKL